MKAESLLATTRRMLRRYELRARKRLGQHFLVGDRVLRQILAAAELTSGDTVLEVGPGLGIMTRQLALRTARVIAVELDDNLAEMLNEELSDCPNVTIINDDILRLDPAALFAEPFSYKVVANLPYYITSPVLRHFLETPAKPAMILVMVQKEVARTIAAADRKSLLSIAVQYFGRPGIVGSVPPRAFYPAPEVDSAILRIEPYREPPVSVPDEKDFFALVRAGFTAPRKQLANSLAQGLKVPRTEVLTLLEQAGISPQRRAETLALEEWAALSRVYPAAEKKPE